MEKSSPYPRYRLSLDQLVTYVGGGGEQEEGGEGHREKLTERLHHQLTTPLKETSPSTNTMMGDEKKETAKSAKATCAPKVIVDDDIDEAKDEGLFSYIRSAPDVTMDIKG